MRRECISVYDASAPARDHATAKGVWYSIAGTHRVFGHACFSWMGGDRGWLINNVCFYSEPV